MSKIWGVLFFLLLIPGLGIGQETQEHILLMTGKVLNGHVTGRDSIFMYYEETRKSGKIRTGKLDLERIYSVTDSTGNEQVIYVMDTNVGNYFSREEMRYYIYGEQDAVQSYKANWVVFAAPPVAGGGAYILSSSFFVLAVPFFYVVGASIPKVKIPSKGLEHPEMLREPAYVLGYERTARTRRIFKALVSGVISTAAGFTIGLATAE